MRTNGNLKPRSMIEVNEWQLLRRNIKGKGEFYLTVFLLRTGQDDWHHLGMVANEEHNQICRVIRYGG
jgi:hypothetical protein